MPTNASNMIAAYSAICGLEVTVRGPFLNFDADPDALKRMRRVRSCPPVVSEPCPDGSVKGPAELNDNICDLELREMGGFSESGDAFMVAARAAPFAQSGDLQRFDLGTVGEAASSERGPPPPPPSPRGGARPAPPPSRRRSVSRRPSRRPHNGSSPEVCGSAGSANDTSVERSTESDATSGCRRATFINYSAVSDSEDLDHKPVVTPRVASAPCAIWSRDVEFLPSPPQQMETLEVLMPCAAPVPGNSARRLRRPTAAGLAPVGSPLAAPPAEPSTPPPQPYGSEPLDAEANDDHLQSLAPGRHSAQQLPAEDGQRSHDMNELPSLGSLRHEAGSCKPCIYFLHGICEAGASCDFCHVAHDNLSWRRVRPPKFVREKLKQAGMSLNVSLVSVAPR